MRKKALLRRVIQNRQNVLLGYATELFKDFSDSQSIVEVFDNRIRRNSNAPNGWSAVQFLRVAFDYWAACPVYRSEHFSLLLFLA